MRLVGLWWHNRADIEAAHRYGLTPFFCHSTISARRVKLRRISEDVAIGSHRLKTMRTIRQGWRSVKGSPYRYDVRALT